MRKIMAEEQSVQRESLDYYIKEACKLVNDKVNEKLSNEAKYKHIYASDIISKAYEEIGYFEKDQSDIDKLDNAKTPQGSHNYTKYSRDIQEKYPNFYSENVQARRWSVTFIDWLFLEVCGETTARRLLCRPSRNYDANTSREDSIMNYAYTNEDIKKYGSCFSYEKSYEAFKNANCIIDKPAVGCIVYFINKDNEFDHIGLVYKFDYRNIYTIEGDFGDCVAKGLYALDDWTIFAYAMPDYDNNADNDMINMHISPERPEWEKENEEFPNDPPIRFNRFTITTHPIPNPIWDVSESESEDGESQDSGSGKLLTPTIQEIADGTVMLVCTDDGTMSVSLKANKTIGEFSNGGDSPYPDAEYFEWAKEEAFYPKTSKMYLIPPDTTAEVIVSNSTYNFRIYNKIGLLSLVGPIQIYDRYENIELNISDLVNCNNLNTIHMFNSLTSGDISSLGQVRSLTSIDLNHTNIYGDIEDLTSLDSCVNLNLYNTSIYGDIKNLDSMQALESFNLNSSGLYGNIDGISKLHKLSVFDFSDTYVYGDLESLKDLHNLTEIWINCDSTVGITGDIKNLSNLENLNRIHLRGKDIYGEISSLNNLPLSKIHFTNSQLTGDLSDFLKSPNALILEEIELINVDSLSGSTSGFKELNEYTYNNEEEDSTSITISSSINKYKESQLNHIYFNNISSKIDLEDFINLNLLQDLQIIECNCDSDISYISNINSLELLSLIDNNIHGNISSLKNNTTLSHLTLHKLKNITGLIDDIPSSVQHFRIIVCPYITGDVGNIKSSNAQEIWIYDTKTSGDVSSIRSSSLKDLRVYNTNVYGNLVSLKKYENLSTLITFSSKIRGNIEDLKKYLPNIIFCDNGKQYDNSKWV